MMLSNLLKVYMKNSFSLKRLFGFDLKKNRIKTIFTSIAIVYGVCVIVGLFGWMFFDLGRVLDDMGQIQILLSFLGVFLVVFPVFLTLFLASGSLFYYKDYDIVGHLPIKPRTIFLAKLIVMLTMLYVITLIGILPIIFSYFYWQGFSFVALIFFIVSLIVIPLISVAVFSLLSLVIAIVTSRIRFGKLLNIIFLFIIFFGFMLLMLQVNDVDVNPLTGQIDLFKGIADAYPPLTWFTKAIGEQDWLSFLYLIGSHGLLFAGFVYGGARLAAYTNKRGIRVMKHSKKGPVKIQQANIVVTLVKKEFKRLFSGVNYALNTLFGVVITIVLSIASLFFGNEIISYLQTDLGGIVSPELIVVMIIGFSVMMTTTPAVSLSLEGKKLWVIKSLPIEPYKIMYAKIFMNLVLIIPMVFIGTLLFGYSSQISLINQLAMMLMLLAFGVAMSFIYGIINMYIPKFEFSNEVEVVKQSLSVLIAIFAGFAMLAINGLLFYFVLVDLNMALSFLILSIINGLIGAVCWYVVRYQSARIFANYQG